ncbi:MAG: hypothetical protein EXS16_18145 [Gemmataceae bacterium]|nr:hypothetical protein [Gemmataceae bacterium]
MRRDPIFLVFTITSPSYDESLQLRERLRHQIEPDAEFVDSCHSSEGTKNVIYRIGDCFEEIAILADDDESGGSFRLVFHRKPTAERFWKEIMVRIVRSLEVEPRVTVSLEYQGDVLPASMRPMLAK